MVSAENVSDKLAQKVLAILILALLNCTNSDAFHILLDDAHFVYKSRILKIKE